MTPRDPDKRRKLDKRGERLRLQALLLGPWFAPIIKVFDEKGVTAEDMLDAMLFKFDPYADDRFARLPEVEYLTGLTRSSIYRQMDANKFPQSVSLDGGAEPEGAVGWSLPAVRAWMRERGK